MKKLGGFVAAVLLGVSAPASAVNGSFEFEYRNSRSGLAEIQRTDLPGGGTASAGLAEAVAAGTVATGRVQAISSLDVTTLGSPLPPQNFLDSFATTRVSHSIFVATAPVSEGFLEIALPYSGTIVSNLVKPPGSPASGDTFSGNTYFLERSISTFIDGYFDTTYQTINGFTFPVYTYVPDFRYFGERSRTGVFEAIGTFANPDRLVRTTFEQTGFQSGQVVRVPFVTGRNMLITLQATCQVRTQDQRMATAQGTCDNSFGWGGLLGASDQAGNAIPLGQIGLEGSKPFFGNFVPLDFDPYANLSGMAFTPIPVANAVPEPANWALLIAGFALIGGIQRRKRNSRSTPWSAITAQDGFGRANP